MIAAKAEVSQKSFTTTVPVNVWFEVNKGIPVVIIKFWRKLNARCPLNTELSVIR